MGTGTYLDEDEEPDLDWDDDEPVESDLTPTTLAPRAIGTLVDLDRHREAFRRKWPPPYREPGTEAFVEQRKWKNPPPPTVPCRDATAAEMCDEVRKAFRGALFHHLQVRVTYAQSGIERRGKDKGKCRCGATVPLYVDTGLLYAHNVPAGEKVACTGRRLNYSKVCATCGQKAKELAKGGLSRHYLKQEAVPCDTSEPDEVVPGDLLPPTESVVVRIKGLGVGAWRRTQPANWKFDVAYLRMPEMWKQVGADEFQRACALGRVQ